MTDSLSFGSQPADGKIRPMEIREALQRISESQTFAKSERLIEFLSFVVEAVLNGHADKLKESSIGVELLKRGAGYDPKLDSIVRTQARRLRERLELYNETEGASDPVVIELPKGAYVPIFRRTRPANVVSLPLPAFRPSSPHRPGPTLLEQAFETPALLRHWAPAVAGALVILAGIFGYFWMHQPPLPKLINYTQITRDGQEKRLAGTDGSRLYFEVGGASSLGIAQVSATGGEPIPVPGSSNGLYPLGLSPDGSEILAMDYPGNLWSLPTLGGPARRLVDANVNDAAWSPDGEKLVYCRRENLFLAKSDGTNPHKLLSVSGRISSPQFSPDGSTLRFNVEDLRRGGNSFWEASAQGTGLHRVLTGWRDPSDEQNGKWTPDGKYFIFQANYQIWGLPEKTGFFHRPSNKPIQLTDSPLALRSPIPSQDGKKIFVTGRTLRGTLSRYDGKSGQLVPFLSGISAEYVAYSKDGRWITYVTYPDGILWRCKPDGSQRLRLSYSALSAYLPRWSPDGKQIVFYGSLPRKHYRIYAVSPNGGSPEQLIPDDPDSRSDPGWSPDGKRIVLARNLNDSSSTIEVLDLESHRLSTLPGSQGFFSPRWSPDGRYIVAMPRNTLSLVLFDFQARKWSELARLPVGIAFPNWSGDGKYVYFLRFPDHLAVLRVRISDHAVERVADLKNHPTVGQWGIWLGLAPDDSPLLLRDDGTEDIYALDWATQ